MNRQTLAWAVGWSNTRQMPPRTFFPAVVPGAVQLDYAAAYRLPDHHFASNYTQYRWMEDVYWTYRAELPPRPQGGGRLFLVSLGIDYRFDVLVNGQTLLQQEGMYTPVELDLTDALSPCGGLLEIVVYPAPKRDGAPAGTRAEADHCCKPPASYGWDWHPRLIPAGIWDETYLEWRDPASITSVEVTYELEPDLSAVHLQAMVASPAPFVEFRLFHPDGSILYRAQGRDHHVSLSSPVLWWCNGMGTPSRYRWEVFSRDGDCTDHREGKVGFRTLRLAMNEGTWKENNRTPQSRSRPPITLCLNGQPLFCKGTNWVMPDIFYGKATRQTYQALLEKARDAHFNLIRCWGGGNVNKDPFYDLCDEMGLMVWQEFPLACNHYPDDDAYLALLEQEARSILLRLRHHPCIALWCGGNELFNHWSGMTEQSLALRLLNKLCYELDRGTPFLYTSPLDGMAHGGYLFLDREGREVYDVMPRSHFTAYPECGVPGFSDMRTLLAALPREELFPLRPQRDTLAHHAFEAWLPGDDTWSCLQTIEYYFGAPSSLEELVRNSQWLQAAGYQCVFEEARRQKPYCSMILNWCFNEPWPCIANNSLLSYPDLPKPAYHAVAESCRPTLYSARLRRFLYHGGEWFEADLWLLNDDPRGVPSRRVCARLILDGAAYPVLDWTSPELQGPVNLPGPTLRFLLPDAPDGALVLELDAGPWSSRYKLLYRPAVTAAGPLLSTPNT